MTCCPIASHCRRGRTEGQTTHDVAGSRQDSQAARAAGRVHPLGLRRGGRSGAGLRGRAGHGPSRVGRRRGGGRTVESGGRRRRVDPRRRPQARTVQGSASGARWPAAVAPSPAPLYRRSARARGDAGSGRTPAGTARARIDGLRARAGLPAFAWTDPEIVPGVTPRRAAHLTGLRSALAAAYAAAGRASPAYTDAEVTAGATAIRAVHLQELRSAVVALEGSP